MRLLLLFEQDLMNLFRNVPASYKFTYTQQVFDQMGFTKRLLVKVLDMPKEVDMEMRIVKYKMLAESRSELRVVEVNLCQLNDLSAISNKVNIKKNRTRLSWFRWINQNRKKAMKEERLNRKYFEL